MDNFNKMKLKQLVVDSDNPECSRYVLPPCIEPADVTRSMVENLLRDARSTKWTLQGFGMLRAYMRVVGRDVRLNVWDSRFAVPKVSTIHTHPWNFTSFVVAGKMYDTVYKEHADYCYPYYMRQDIKCGEGGGLLETPTRKRLYKMELLTVGTGCSYGHIATDIHESDAEIGTVTLNFRERVGDGEVASVYWPIGEHWVSAEPRPATHQEVDAICGMSLDRWF